MSLLWFCHKCLRDISGEAKLSALCNECEVNYVNTARGTAALDTGNQRDNVSEALPELLGVPIDTGPV